VVNSRKKRKFEGGRGGKKGREKKCKPKRLYLGGGRRRVEKKVNCAEGGEIGSWKKKKMIVLGPPKKKYQ